MEKNNLDNNLGKNTTEYSRKNVDKIKRMLMAIFVIMFALPVLLCIYLMIRLSGIERKLDDISLGSAKVEKTETVAENIDEDLALKDLTAYSELDIHRNSGETLAAGNSYVETPSDANEDNSFNNKKQNLNGKKVYLTFDDGPSIYTNELLDILKKNNVKATFFVVHYDNKDLWPAYQRIVDEGHTLAMHSYTHIYKQIYASEEAFKNDVDSIHDFLYDLTGYDCKYYRFPGGSSNNVSNVDMQLCMKYLNEKGITYFDWNSLSGDAEGGYHTVDSLNEKVLKYVRENEGDSIVLMHDLSDRHLTVEGLQTLIDTLKEEGYELCAIDDNTKLVQHVEYDPSLIEETN